MNISILGITLDAVQVAESIITIAAIMLGGSWAYWRFVYLRQKFPHANITHEITTRAIGTGIRLLHVTVTIENMGDVLLKLGDSTLRVQQILPLSAELAEALEQGEDLFEGGNTEILWPGVTSKDIDLAQLPMVLEPGEKDEILYDFILEDSLQTVKIYSYYSNIIESPELSGESRSPEIGWKKTTFHDIGDN